MVAASGATTATAAATVFYGMIPRKQVIISPLLQILTYHLTKIVVRPQKLQKIIAVDLAAIYLNAQKTVSGFQCSAGALQATAGA